MGSSGDLSLKVLLSAVDSGMSSMIQSLGGMLGGLGGPAAAAAAALASVAVQSVQAAANWQSSLTSLVTGAGESQKNLAMVSNGMLNMAVATGTTTQQLSAGMYMIESAGYHGAAGLAVLKNAAEGAKVGNADLAAVANGTTTALTDYHIAASKSASVVNDLIATVANGKTTMQQLSTSLSGILPVSSAAGVSFGDTSAALATMTGEGVPAAQAATFLRQTILSLLGPSGAASKMLSSVGLTTQQVASKMKQSLPDALHLITEAVGKKFPAGSAGYIAALKTIVGGTKNLQGTLDLTGTHLSTFKANVQNIAGAVKKGGNSITGWNLVQGTFNQKMAEAQEMVQVLMIRIGTALLPTVTQLLSSVMKAATNFGNWLQQGNKLHNALNLVKTVVKGLAGGAENLVKGIGSIVTWFSQGSTTALVLRDALLAIGAAIAVIKLGNLIAAIPTLLAEMGAWLVATWAQVAAYTAEAIAEMAANWPIYLIIAAILIIIGIIILLVQHWNQVVAFLRGVWTTTVNAVKAGLAALGQFFQNIFHAIGNAFVWLYNHNTYFKKLIDTIMKIVRIGLALFRVAWNMALTWLVHLWNSISGFATKAWQAVSSVFGSIWSKYIAGPLSSLWHDLTSWFGNLANMALQWGKNMIQGFINGIKNMAGAVGNAAQGIIKNVAGFLGFHSPAKQGEGRHIIEWGANMIAGFNSGVLQAIPQLQATVSLAMKTGMSPMSPPALASTIPAYGRPPMSSSTSNYSAGGNHYYGPVTVVAQGADAKSVAKEVFALQNSQYRRSGVFGNPAQGVRNS